MFCCRDIRQYIDIDQSRGNMTVVNIKFTYREVGTDNSNWYRVQHREYLPTAEYGGTREEDIPWYYRDARRLEDLNLTVHHEVRKWVFWVDSDKPSRQTLLELTLGNRYDIERIIGTGPVAIIDYAEFEDDDVV